MHFLKLKFLVLFLLIGSHPAFAAASDTLLECTDASTRPSKYMDTWQINSPGYTITWGKEHKGWFVASVDLRDPPKSNLIIDPESTIKFQEAAKEIFASNMSEVSNRDTCEVTIKDLEEFVRNLAAIKSSCRSTSDDGLLKSIATSPGLIWSGAGISLAAGVPSLQTFYEELGLTSIPYTHMVAEEGLRGMDIAGKKGTLFHLLDGIFNAKSCGLVPSPAHHAIKKILEATHSQYITSNLDNFEKELGYAETVKYDVEDASCPLRIRSSEEPFLPTWVLMVGVRADDYGLAAWAKRRGITVYYVGPNAPELVYIEDKMPIQMEVEWIRADAQTYLPELYKRLRARLKPIIPIHALHLFSF